MSIYDAQSYHTNQTHYLRKMFTFADDGLVLSLGWVPAGTVILRGGVVVTTAFNAGSTNVLDVGFRASGSGATTDDDSYATDLALGTRGVIVADEMASTINAYHSLGAEITATVDLTGTAATAGVGRVWVEYLVLNA